VKALLDGQMLFEMDGKTFSIKKMDKDSILRDLRNWILDDTALRWLDAAFVIGTGVKKNRLEAPLLGSGGNIGNSDFSVRFMQSLIQCVPPGGQRATSDLVKGWLENALFGRPTDGLLGLAVDQFYPGRAGGANMSQTMSAKPIFNPWDYVLMLEGALLLQGATAKRLGTDNRKPAFPFVVENTPVGFGSAGYDESRGEQWLPLWERACSKSEIGSLFAEGRCELGSRAARTGVDFARAVVTLGVDRGITQFVRIQYQKRFGENYLANSLGRFEVSEVHEVRLLPQIDLWLDEFRRTAHREKTPRLNHALRAIDSAILDFCRYRGKSLFQGILIALGRAERELAVTTGKMGQSMCRPFPLAGLTPDWIGAADDGCTEFLLARALSGVHDPERKTGPLRANLEPVDWRESSEKRSANWTRRDRAVVWNANDISDNLAAILARRMQDGQRQGCENPPLASPAVAPLAAIGQFIAGATDDRRIEDLLWALMLVRPTESPQQPEDASQIPVAYALLKLLFLPRPLVFERGDGGRLWVRYARRGESGVRIRAELRVPHLLRAGRLGEACVIAVRRLRASGLAPMPHPQAGRTRDRDWGELDVIGMTHLDPVRVAAALPVPIGDRGVQQLVRLITRPEAIQTEFH
jgi:CRISPR-associated protein Csx17